MRTTPPSETRMGRAGRLARAVVRVAPPQPVPHRGEVVVGPAQADREQRRAETHKLVGLFRREPTQFARDLDLAHVTTDRLAVLGEDAQFALEGLGVAEAVPDVRVLGDDAQRLLLPARTDENRDGAGGRRVQLRPAIRDDGEGVRERRDPRAGRAELVAVLRVVALEPARAGAEDEATD